MSKVSGITLHISCAEEFIERKADRDTVPIVDAINYWLASKSFRPLVSVEEHYGGSKHPQILVYGGGYNYFPEEEFSEFVLSLPWKYPENLILLINPEDGCTRVVRPGAFRPP